MKESKYKEIHLLTKFFMVFYELQLIFIKTI
jgi:hypothetical protein